MCDFQSTPEVSCKLWETSGGFLWFKTTLFVTSKQLWKSSASRGKSSEDFFGSKQIAGNQRSF
ncbi:hypothetical protein N0B16_05975 [Chryseobacterium sp. GMJ5]|uniref:Uncharacterized protein n=1 Tax=Chryseobacterium gilvum TaxID=2976534 RepID=A0ABT2VWH9_9FLAO|nr:hypothetical protein [Chryseobacterium gilvum]MCU7613979.1 hypothetical protein [Chryseobacterium gilvum]